MAYELKSLGSEEKTPFPEEEDLSYIFIALKKHEASHISIYIAQYSVFELIGAILQIDFYDWCVCRSRTINQVLKATPFLLLFRQIFHHA